MPASTEFYINGQWVAPHQPDDFPVIDPSTEEVCATISLGSEADTNAAVAAAKAAFNGWAATPIADRIAALQRLRDVYKKRAGEMAEAISQEMGAPIDLAKQQQVGAGIWHLDGFLNAAKEFAWDHPLGPQAPTERILHEPIGVCALITPWNWPMNQIVLKCAPALVTGCTMILKPSEIAPLSGLLFAEMMDEADLPPGVFNMVNGDGPGVGSTLSAHPDVDMVSFTGSTRAGRLISIAAADTIKRVSLELGGKGANIIFADADEKAVKSGVIRCFRNTGQSCNAPTRMMVERSRYDQAVEIAAATAQATTVGPANEEGRHIGPAVSEMQFNKIQDLIQKGIDEGARLVAGGTGRPENLNRGYYIRPTVFADVTPDMTIYREEIFGPVLSVIPFEDEAHAVEMANDTPYGLTNYIQTGDNEKLRRVARQLRSGMVEGNGVGFGQGSPFGGFKQSGNGREGGSFGLHEFLEIKAVSGWGE
ncbi:aldehyde dehydrogenase family protein [Roseobacter sp. HKCCD9010]|uniref:aldehyde dehydrogenase family protein n=1 Tax=unclassified Roseobacter TaxID=196798 RepID=UPI001490EBD3|nr:MULTISPECIES: aldehyde dehydrogenase family protein [unclassified Roseobacter]MBF9048623.1 aldehyde dehydrogenase family protein [Rhodobacterales bacterium HKCCD4356]NNV10622.1 aldehyde dehydrogenase family protein [Roseobacter sp. HKCCD7357]NNV14807.1 aldehyde dehydrogenase family protein [Roseobacter sp. HKCCD8768]NNV24266.1 aldehyde dehydrogenase family protein [Roseobacter sp. HKCCD8192]NNV28523.1 aldehyde dehydrogenase family protein [Roseobacter sp. HKCCD9061]